MNPLPSTELFGSSKIEIHYKRPHFSEMHHITGVDDAVKLLRKYIEPKQLDLRECFWVILMTNSSRVLGISEVAQGTTRGVLINKRYIFQLALLVNASSILLCHNHPSGNLKPSKTDLKETNKVMQLAKLHEMTLLDHIIISSESHLSFVTEDLI